MRSALAVLALGLLAGCSAYRLGGPAPAFNRLEIGAVRNATSRAGTHAVLQQKLAESFAADPRIKLGPGGAKLAVEVTQYRREGLTTKPNDAYVYTSFRATFVVRCSLTTADGRVLFRNRDFSATATLQAAGDAAAEERSLDGPLFADIAAQVREAATTAW
jgi:hypothetical protein